ALPISMIAIAAAAFALTAALPIERAHADSNFDINVGLGFGGFVGPGYGSVEVDFEGEYVSCAQARKMVRWNGFSDVKSLDCSAPNYKFSGWRDGNKYKIKVNSWGDITRISSY
ncbi:MAG: hypothetical protein IOC86_15680, partial [Aestuariivirga sp.]|nr:hypothetical protein [Aestuariivirga sp.]